MRLITTFAALGLCASNSIAQPSPLDFFIAKEAPIAREGLFANIGAKGFRSQGAKAGVVVASPSTVDPDYLFTWVRDSALVFKTVVDQYIKGDSSLKTLIDEFVASQSTLQQVSNPSGTVKTGGLGEPKFQIDETAYTESWGRPQRDGPALRSTAIVTYGNHGGNTEALWPVVKLDLDYGKPNMSCCVALTWNRSGFDLWEEVSGSSFFTTAVQHRALVEGVAFAAKAGDSESADRYRREGAKSLCFLQSYWNPSKGYITSNTAGGRSGIDANSALASIHTFDPEAGCDAASFQPCSDKALSSLKVFVDSFRSVYPINAGIPANKSVAVGRYAEDVYYTGHPWYLTTAVVAEQLYDALIVWDAQGSLEVTPISLAFFQQFDSSIVTGTYQFSSSEYNYLTASIRAFADGFLEVIQKYTPADGSLAEQYTKQNGTPISAKHLTWSYASFLTTIAARNGTVPASWGAKGLAIPAVCEVGEQAPTVPVTFKITAETSLGENIFIVGSVDGLKNWDPANALILSPASYPVWSITVNLEENTNIQYKYIRKNANGDVSWGADPNWGVSTTEEGSEVNDVWR